jgi:hypothetical protein
MRYKRVIITAMLALTLACASMSPKQKATVTIQGIETSLEDIHTAEVAICQPVILPNHCTMTVILDAQHQAFSKMLEAAVSDEIALAQATRAWTGTGGVPLSLTALETDLKAAYTSLISIADARVGAVTNLIITLLNTLSAFQLTFGG